MQINLKKVLAISEHSGLFLFISESKNGAIVESLIDKKRTCMSSRTRMTSLADIAVYTTTGELQLKEVLERMKNLPEEREIPGYKSEAVLLRSFFEEVIPDYDPNRFYVSHMKKIVEWFRILRGNDTLEFEAEGEKAEGGKEEGGEDREAGLTRNADGENAEDDNN